MGAGFSVTVPGESESAAAGGECERAAAGGESESGGNQLGGSPNSSRGVGTGGHDFVDIELKNGDRYEGQTMVQGQGRVKTGPGIYRYRNGDVYLGSFEEGLMHGYGVYRHATGKQ